MYFTKTYLSGKAMKNKNAKHHTLNINLLEGSFANMPSKMTSIIIHQYSLFLSNMQKRIELFQYKYLLSDYFIPNLHQ